MEAERGSLQSETEYRTREEESVRATGHTLDRDVPDNPWKVYVEVSAVFSPDGKLTPRRIRWIDGRVYTVEKVIDVRRAASLRAGGIGMRYECRIDGKETYLYYERDRWFVERRGE